MKNDRLLWPENSRGRLLRPSRPYPVLFVAALALGAWSSPLRADAYVQTNLVSDLAGTAANTDPNLVGAWGVARSDTGPWWVNTTIGGTSNVYNGTGQPFPVASPLVVAIPAPAGMSVPSLPTGLAVNSGQNFTVAAGHPARFIFVTRTGSISGWNPQVDAKNAVIAVDHGGSADYTGVTLTSRNGMDTLYVANFKTGQIEAYDGTFAPVTLPTGAFMDSNVSSDLTVFNVQAINGELYVTYAPKDIFTPSGGGAGQGDVAVFDPNGTLLRRLRHGPWMNAPWGVALAPSSGFGRFSGHLVVGMFGNGHLVGFDPANGNFHGRLRGTRQNPLTLAKGLWGIGFGNGATGGSATSLYFAADIVQNGKFHGLFGTISAASDGNDGGDNNADRNSPDDTSGGSGD